MTKMQTALLEASRVALISGTIDTNKVKKFIGPIFNWKAPDIEAWLFSVNK